MGRYCIMTVYTVNENTVINIANWCNQMNLNISQCISDVLASPATTQIINNWHSVIMKMILMVAWLLECIWQNGHATYMDHIRIMATTGGALMSGIMPYAIVTHLLLFITGYNW